MFKSNQATQSFSRHELAAIRERIECENDLQKYLKAGLEAGGWDVLREMNPDNSNKRVDIVAIKPEFGRIGIETKYRSDGSAASHASEALRQIYNDYSTKRYLGERIDLWAIAIYGTKYDHEGYDESDFPDRQYYLSAERARQARLAEVERMVQGLGVGWVTAYADRVMAKFSAEATEYKMPLFTLEKRGMPSRYKRRFDREHVLRKCRERRL